MRTVRQFLPAVLPEALEDRIVLTGPNFAAVGPSLEGILNQLQASVNEHLLAPTKVSYSLPLVGTQLAQPNDPVGQVFANLAGNQIASAFQQTPSGPQAVVGDLKTALEAFNPTIANPVNSDPDVFTIQASTSTPLTEQVALQLGLPGLSLFDVSASQAVNAHLTFSLNLTFGIDQSGVFVDPTQNHANSPLLNLAVTADLKGFPGVAADLNGIPAQVTDSSQSPSQLNVPVSFNSSAKAPIHGFSAGSIDQVNFANKASADVNLHYAMTVAQAFDLTLDLGVQWPLTSTQTGVSPFDSLNDSQIPTVTFDAGADLNTLAEALNPASSPLIQDLEKEIKPLQHVVDFFYQPIPVLSDLGITVTPRDLLGNFLPSQDQGFLTGLDALHDFLDAAGTFSLPQGGQVNFAGSSLPSTADPRTSLSSGSVVAAIEAHAQQDVSQIQKEIDPFLQTLGTALDGTIQLPILAAPSLAFDALLTSDNVALFQYTINPINLPVLNSNLGPPIGPIVPPFPIFLQLTAGFGLSAGFTIGYDTYGFANPAHNPLDGLFLADASAQLTGQLGISGELDLGVLQAGANGSIGMNFGVTGINTSGPFTHSVQTVDSNNHQVPETVLQLDDFSNDVANGGPFCPFTVGGSLGLSLSVFVTIGVGPFSISFDYPLGDVTLFDFSCPSCQPPAPPQLAETVTDLNSPQVPGLPVANILQQLPGTTQVVVLDMGDYASRRRNVNDSGSTSEDFEVSLPTDPKQIAAHALQVQAFGAVEFIPGADNPNTTIVALADTGTLPETITVDQGVQANAYFVGGPVHNEFEYLGTGNTFMQGGTWNAALGDPAQLEQPIQTLNTLQGGFGQNTLIGGNLSATGYDAEKAPQWNVLNANPAEVLGPGQDGGRQDTLQAGSAGATMKGGALGGDTFLGSSDPLSQDNPGSVNSSIPSQYVMIAGKDEDNLGSDLMEGGLGQYRFEWQEGAAPLTVKGDLRNGTLAKSKEVDVWGSQANESWTISPARAGDFVGVQITGQDAVQKPIAQIDAFSVQTVSVDAEDQHNAGGESYTINDLSTTGVSQVNVNLHQFLTNPDGNADHVVVNGPSTSSDVNLDTFALFSGQFDQNGHPIFSNQRTEMIVTTQVPPGNNPVGGRTVTYKVDTALPKSSDTLNLNTFGGHNTVEVRDTQPSQTEVATGPGDNTVTVGGGFNGLDDIEGPLVVDAGSGHDQLIFDETASLNGDVVTLTTNLLPVQNPTLHGLQTSLLGQLSESLTGPEGYVLRYQGEALSPRTVDALPAYRFAVGMTFLASGGGDFSRGVSFLAPTSVSPNQIYVDGLLPNAPTSVATDGASDQVYVGFDGGPTGETSDPASTLDNLNSPLSVVDQNHSTTSLIIDDEGTARPDTYVVAAGKVVRKTVPASIQYQHLGALDLIAPPHQNNTLQIFGTAQGTNTTVDAGDGNNSISVGEPVAVLVGPHPHVAAAAGSSSVAQLDEVLGPLTIHGGAGLDPLSIDDSANGKAQSYQLHAGSLLRTSSPQVSINFDQISSLSFHASENTGTNNITVAGTPAGVPVTVQPGGGNAALTVASLDNIQGALTFPWSQGTKTLSVQDDAAAETATYQVLPNQIQRTGAAVIQFQDGSDPLASISLAAGQLHAAEVDIPETIAATPVTLSLAGSGNQVFVSAAREDLDSLQGQLNIEGFATAILDDQDGPAGRTYVLTPGSLQFNPALPPILFSSSALTLNGASAGSNTLVGPSGINTLTGLTLNGASAGSNPLLHPNSINTWSITGTNSGTVDGLSFSGIANLTGGTGLDAFVFSAGASVTGRINSGGGGDWLDYAAFTTPVTVDLATGTATAVGDGIANINSVRGGQGGNTLTGDAQPNILIGGAGANTITGGSGPSILIGGGGRSTIKAGSGDTILIGGTTIYDSSSIAHDLALESILAEWASPKPFATRVKDITKGGGLNGSNTLVWRVNAHDDGNADTLIGGSGNNWFFKGAHDTVTPGKPAKGNLIVGKNVPTRLRRFEVLRTRRPHPPRFRPKGHHRR